MVRNLVRKAGVPAFAYSSTDASSTLEPCDLMLLYSDTNTQFTVLLEAPVAIHDVDDKHTFGLRFDGDNLVPGNISLEHTKIPPSEEMVDKMAREGQPELRVLSLTLKAPCSVWYPRALGSEVSSFDISSHGFLDLAKTTGIRILFDIRWLGSNLPRFRSLLESPSQCTGVPVVQGTIYTRLYAQADWSIFNFLDKAKPGGLLVAEAAAPKVVPSVEIAAVGAPSIDNALDDAPPAYSQASSKRSRNARTSLTPDSPDPKRFLQDSTRSLPPLERNGSPSSSTATVQVDIFQDVVKSAVEKVLPDVLREQLPGILQDMLPGMLAGLSPSPSSSPNPPSRQTKTAPAPAPEPTPTSSLNPTLATTFKATVRTLARVHLQKFLTDTMAEVHEQASELYHSAGIDLGDDLDDHRLDIAMIKEDHISEFGRELDQEIADFKMRIAEIKEQAEEQVQEHADKVTDNLCAGCRCKCLKHGNLGAGWRATSLPPP